MIKYFLLSFAVLEVVLCGLVKLEIETTTIPPPPRPYAFGYAAGRYPGSVDRTHSEISDGSGVIQGSYSYLDPSNKVRTVDYTADKNGFHPTLNFAPTDTRAVAEAKAKHEHLYHTIAEKHQSGAIHIPRDSAAVAHAKEAHLQRYNQIAAQQHVQPGVVLVPVDTLAVQQKTQKHFDLYAQIAAEHARIAAEREAEREEKKRLGLLQDDEHL